jgi:DNA-binding LacI/PurR family transcriptional regulator
MGIPSQLKHAMRHDEGAMEKNDNTTTTRRVTSIDVARLANVSQSAVSRTFSENGKVSAETRAKVLAAARALGYTPNAIARSLITQRTNIIGMVMADITNPFYPNVLEMFTQRLREMGQQVFLITVPPDQDTDDLLPLLLQYQVDAVIITSATLSSEMAHTLAQQSTPVILFNRYVPNIGVSAVCCDNVEGGRLVANLLLDGGHKRVAYIAGKRDTSTNIDREKGFTDRLRERGVTEWLREQGEYTYESGYEATYRLLRSAARPTAIFCANDIMALGALDAARSAGGLKVPDDVSIVGFDDIPAASWPAYDLTTIHQPVNRMIAVTLDLLKERLDNPQAEPVLKLLPGVLVRRGSARIGAAEE